jgi:hypothetical protein
MDARLLHRSINVIQHISRSKYKNHMILPVMQKKALAKSNTAS